MSLKNLLKSLEHNLGTLVTWMLVSWKMSCTSACVSELLGGSNSGLEKSGNRLLGFGSEAQGACSFTVSSCISTRLSFPFTTLNRPVSKSIAFCSFWISLSWDSFNTVFCCLSQPHLKVSFSRFQVHQLFKLPYNFYQSQNTLTASRF